MTYIKICGITNREDANAAVDLGADVLGFIGITQSPRYVSALDFQRVRDVLPPDFPTVVVVKRAGDASRYHSRFVQYYEESELDDGLELGTKKIRVFRIHDAGDVELARQHRADSAVLLDAFHAALLGGSGTRFDWEMLHGGTGFALPNMLAGGLNHKNVVEAVTVARPYGVDVSSGVEEQKTPGKKNHELLKWFITAVREWDMRSGTADAGADFLA